MPSGRTSDRVRPRSASEPLDRIHRSALPPPSSTVSAASGDETNTAASPAASWSHSNSGATSNAWPFLPGSVTLSASERSVVHRDADDATLGFVAPRLLSGWRNQRCALRPAGGQAANVVDPVLSGAPGLVVRAPRSQRMLTSGSASYCAFRVAKSPSSNRSGGKASWAPNVSPTSAGPNCVRKPGSGVRSPAT